MDSRVFFALSVIIVGLFVSAEAADPAKKKCYVCTDCGDPFDVNAKQNTLKDCTANEFFCFKSVSNDMKIQRGCATKENECPTTGKKCVTCVTPKCNSGHRLSVAYTLPAVVIIIASLAKFFNAV